MLATYDFTLDRWPSGGIVLPFSPVLSIESIKYYDADDNQQTWAATNYKYNANSEPCKIEYVNGTPGINEDKLDAITVQFKAGYSSSATLATQQDAVPPPLKAAILKIVTDLYYNRNDNVREKMSVWNYMAYPFRVFHFPVEND